MDTAAFDYWDFVGQLPGSTTAMMILPTYSPCRVESGRLLIDRKFHVGTCLYAELLNTPILVIAPRLGSADQRMDFVDVAIKEAPYSVRTIDCDGRFQLSATDRRELRPVVAKADLVYGLGFDLQGIARELERPYIAVVEYNLRTLLQVARLSTSDKLRQVSRTLKALVGYCRETRDLRAAHSVHCNGYPMYLQSRRFHRDCLLYLDSRMSEDMLIEPARLEARLNELTSGRRPRLLYSGRYEAMKGAMDVVEVGLELARRGYEFELNLFGKGRQAEAMRSRVSAAGAEARVRVHDAIPYPELVERSHDSDLFVCCHVQDDPSCTYLEASGSGLPIAGYGNRMWSHFAEAAGNGVVTKRGRPKDLADAIVNLLSNPEHMQAMSRRSRQFAHEHSFEREFDLRVRAIKKLLRR